VADTKEYDVEYAWKDDGQGNRSDEPHTKRLNLTDVQVERFRRAVDYEDSNVVGVTEVPAT
jgi:hypothetical protein